MSKVLFLPEGYQAPKSSGFYMKFQDGENKFRILSRPIIGWEDWMDKKPIRYRMDQKPQKPVDPKKPIKHFWAMIVWNYNVEEIQILQITQTTLKKSLEALCCDKDWGSPYYYDIKVIKQGEGMDTEYSLNPVPHKQLSPHIEEMFSERPCYLEALFDGEDPFSRENPRFTQGIFSKESAKFNTITHEQAYNLEMILEECNPRYREWVKDYIKKKYQTEDLADLPLDIYDKVHAAAVKNMEETHLKQQFPDSEKIAAEVQ